MEFNYANKGVAGAGLGLGIAGTALGLLNNNGGFLGGLFGNGHCAYPAVSGVNHYELTQQKEIIDRDSEIAYLRSRDAAKSDALELYRYIDGKFNALEGQIAAQAVVNAQITANISCMQNAIAALNGLTKTVIPIGNICPEPMARYNTWTAPTATADTAAAG